MSNRRPTMSVLNEIAARRKTICKQIRVEAKVRDKDESRAIIVDALRAEREALGSRRLWDVLGWCYRMTEFEKCRVFRAAGIRDMYRRVRDLTDRQLEVIGEALRDPETRREAA